MTGLYPLDPEQIDYSKCVKDQQVREIENAEELTIDDCGLLHLRTGRRFLEERIGHDKLQMFESQYGGEWLGDVEDTSLFLLWSKLQDLLSMICQVKIFKKQATQVMPFKKQATQVMPFKTQATQVMPFKTQATQVMPFKMQATQVMPFKKQATQVIPFQLKILQLNFFIPMIHVLHLLAIAWQITLNHHMKPLQQLILLVTHPMLL
eukprot:Em0001g611a